MAKEIRHMPALTEALASYVPALRRPFITRKEMAEEVERRAHEVFARERVRRTTPRSAADPARMSAEA